MSSPKIYNTSIPSEFRDFLNSDQRICTIHAPTGHGKTVMGICEIIEYVRAHRAIHSSRSRTDTPITSTSTSINNFTDDSIASSSTPITSTSISTNNFTDDSIASSSTTLRKKIKAYVVMPYRVSVLRMHSYISNKYNYDTIGYAMKNDSQKSPNNYIELNTVGYFLERFIFDYNRYKLGEKSSLSKLDEIIIFLDEIHDKSWQTTLLQYIIQYARETSNLNLRIVLASATINVDEISQIFATCPLKLQCPTESSGNIIHFRDEKITPTIMSCIYTIMNGRYKSNILVILPGRKEIEHIHQSLILEIKKRRIYNVAVFTLYSGMDKSDINRALTSEQYRCKILLATNIVENAITINNLDYVIDSCIRNVLIGSGNDIPKLMPSLATRSNLIQSAGRVGRQGKRGNVYYMISESKFKSLSYTRESELFVNPMYEALLKLYQIYNNKSDIYHIFHNISRCKIDKDTQELVDYGLLDEYDNHPYTKLYNNMYDFRVRLELQQKHGYGLGIGKLGRVADGQSGYEVTESEIIEAITAKCYDHLSYKITNIGEIVSKLSLPVNMGIILAKFMLNEDRKYLYYAVLLVTMLTSQYQMFYFNRKNNRKDTRNTKNTRDTDTKNTERYKRFIGKDSIETFFNVWNECERVTNLETWCKMNDIYEPFIKSIDNGCYRLITTLKNIGYNITNDVIDYPVFRQVLVRVLKSVFIKWEMFGSICTQFTRKYPIGHHDSSYIIDRVYQPGQKNKCQTYSYCNILALVVKSYGTKNIIHHFFALKEEEQSEFTMVISNTNDNNSIIVPDTVVSLELLSATLINKIRFPKSLKKIKIVGNIDKFFIPPSVTTITMYTDISKNMNGILPPNTREINIFHMSENIYFPSRTTKIYISIFGCNCKFNSNTFPLSLNSLRINGYQYPIDFHLPDNLEKLELSSFTGELHPMYIPKSIRSYSIDYNTYLVTPFGHIIKTNKFKNLEMLLLLHKEDISILSALPTEILMYIIFPYLCDL